MERTGDNWSEAVQISSLINSGGSETLRSITENGSIYFTRYNENASGEGRLHEIYVPEKLTGIIRSLKNLMKILILMMQKSLWHILLLMKAI